MYVIFTEGSFFHTCVCLCEGVGDQFPQSSKYNLPNRITETYSVWIKGSIVDLTRYESLVNQDFEVTNLTLLYTQNLLHVFWYSYITNHKSSTEKVKKGNEICFTVQTSKTPRSLPQGNVVVFLVFTKWFQSSF